MFDCGEGTQRQILETTIKPRKVKKIFITHMHGDHIFGLPGFLASRSFQSSEEQTDLEVYGPVGIKQYVMTSLRTSGTRLPTMCILRKLMSISLAWLWKMTSSLFMQISWIIPFFVLVTVWFKRILKEPLDAEALKAAGVPFGPLLVKLRMGKMWFLKMELKSLPRTLFPHLRKVRLSLS